MADPEERPDDSGRDRSRRPDGNRAERFRALWVGPHRRRRARAGAGRAPRRQHVAAARHAAPALNDELPPTSTSLTVEVVPHRFQPGTMPSRAATLSDRDAPDRVRQAVRLVGQGAVERRAHARGGAAFVGMRDFRSFARTTTARAGTDPTLVLVDCLDRRGGGRPRAGRWSKAGIPLEDGAAHRRRPGGDWPRRAAARCGRHIADDDFHAAGTLDRTGGRACSWIMSGTRVIHDVRRRRARHTSRRWSPGDGPACLRNPQQASIESRTSAEDQANHVGIACVPRSKRLALR